jgi:hypothetical protein
VADMPEINNGAYPAELFAEGGSEAAWFQRTGG